ncbi:MAG: VWA domain-containing protein [Gammaproteobacteria bacterium]|nr:VWA domain-containing protein [Gammaproteobacteria bacterium]
MVKEITGPSGRADVDAFLRKAAQLPATKTPAVSGRLVFALDATASREASWDRACQLQGEMFSETQTLGGLRIQLCYYRGFNEFYAGPWVAAAAQLCTQMSAVHCAGGYTQIGKVLTHALHETRQQRVNALVFVGDCVEEEIDQLCRLAGQLGMLAVPVFIFHEGGDADAESAFRQIARLSGGAYSAFNAGSAQQLRDLLGAVAVYAAGGERALQRYGLRKGDAVRLLSRQIGKGTE